MSRFIGLLSRFFGLIVGAGLGYVAGLFGGLVWYCELVSNPSNLCGVIAIFMTGPIGSVIGAIVGYLVGRKGGEV